MANLLGTIQQSAGALNAAQIGLQVVGNNIANANTPGYIRQTLNQAAATGTRQGNLIEGGGVRPLGIVQQIDQQIFERMINAKTSLEGSNLLREAYGRLEEMTNDLEGGGLNEQLSLFNNALQELSVQPNDPSLREFVTLQATSLADRIRQNRNDALGRAELYNAELSTAASEINKLARRIADLNVEIATLEGGGALDSDATGLRDRRYQDLEELAGYLDINIQEQSTGVINVFVGGDYLISNGIPREVRSAYNEEIDGQEIRIVETDSPVQSSGGIVGSAIAARDEVFGSYVDNLDRLTAGLIRGVNELHAQGQGGRGHRSIVADKRVDAFVPLVDAGLPFEPRNGSFDVTLVDDAGLPISTHRIGVRKLGQVGDSTVASIAADLDAIDGLTTSIDSRGQLTIASDSPAARFTFSDDNSGFLAAAGINTFFTGTSSLDIGVNPTVIDDPDLISVSLGGIGNDTDALTGLIDLINQPLDHLDGQSVRGLYERTITGLAQRVSLQQGASDGLENFYATLRSQHLGITGVNIDEESINMIGYQRAFQASSRVIQTASEMLELLVNL